MKDREPIYLGGPVNRVACEPIWETEMREARERLLGPRRLVQQRAAEKTIPTTVKERDHFGEVIATLQEKLPKPVIGGCDIILFNDKGSA